MRADITFGFQVAPVGNANETDTELYEEALADARLGQALGYSVAWMIEHHFSDYFPTPNPLMMLSHIAASCPGLGLGTSVMVLPWYNPLRFAEDVCMLQTLAVGDLHIGIGRGTAKLEYDAFEINMEEARERFKEAWEIVRGAIDGKQFTYKGRYLSVDKEISLRPHLGPRRPNFYGAIGSPQSAEIMANLDLPPLALAQFPDHILSRILENWKTARRANNQSDQAVFPIQVQCYIGDTDEEARLEAKKYLPLYFQRQVEHYEVLKNPWKDIVGYEQFSRFFENLVNLSDPSNIDKFLDMNAVGSPKTVIKRLGELSDIGFNHFLMSTSTPGVPREVRHRTMRRFAGDIMPAFQQAAIASE